VTPRYKANSSPTSVTPPPLPRPSSLLLSAPETAGPLSQLYQALDTRLAVFKRLLRLQGRLDILLAQVDRPPHRIYGDFRGCIPKFGVI